MRATRSHTCICKPLFNSPYRSHCRDTRCVPHPVRINSNTSGKMSFLLFPFPFSPFFPSFFLSFFFFCFIFHFCGTVMAWINTMTGCFRLSGFSRRYFRRTRELVNSLAAGTSTVCGEEEGEGGREVGREEERAKCMCSKRVETSLQTVRSRLRHHRRHHPRSKTHHPRFALFLSLPRSFVPLWCTSCRRWRDRGARRTRPCPTYYGVHTRTVYPHMPHRKWENEMNRE